jgi:hypothetical protein
MTDQYRMPPARKQIIWIASYPKSGNTWVRFLLCNLVFGAVESAADLNRMAPDLHELRDPSALPDQPLFLKTHFPFSPALPLAEHTAGAIYVVRNPADVMMSNFHYARRSGAAAADAHDPGELDRYVERFIQAGGDPRWIELGMAGWEQNVRSWIGTRHSFPVLRLRYEDILADAAQAARQLCTFLGLTRSEQELAQAVAGASFERMRAIEEADIRAQRVGIFYKPYLQEPISAGLRFMRSGRTGEAAMALSADQRARLDATVGVTARALGYGPT